MMVYATIHELVEYILIEQSPLFTQLALRLEIKRVPTSVYTTSHFHPFPHFPFPISYFPVPNTRWWGVNKSYFIMWSYCSDYFFKTFNWVSINNILWQFVPFWNGSWKKKEYLKQSKLGWQWRNSVHFIAWSSNSS